MNTLYDTEITIHDAVRFMNSIIKTKYGNGFNDNLIDASLNYLKELEAIKIQHKVFEFPCGINDKLFVIDPLWMYSDGRNKDGFYKPMRITEDFAKELVVTDTGVHVKTFENHIYDIESFGKHVFVNESDAIEVLRLAKLEFETK